MSSLPPDPEVSALESALKRLVPAGQLRRDEIMYRAGRAAAGRRGWIWPALAVAMTAVAAAIAVRPLWQPEPQRVTERTVVVLTLPAAAPSAPATDEVPPTSPERFAAEQPTGPVHHPGNYYQMQKQVLRWGVDSLPAPAPVVGGSGGPSSLHSLLQAAREGGKELQP
jgi:hypothetical protein